MTRGTMTVAEFRKRISRADCHLNLGGSALLAASSLDFSEDETEKSLARLLAAMNSERGPFAGKP